MGETHFEKIVSIVAKNEGIGAIKITQTLKMDIRDVQLALQNLQDSHKLMGGFRKVEHGQSVKGYERQYFVTPVSR
jgi:hypothetical protein